MINAKEIHSYLQNHTINDACKHFKCSFKELVNYTNIYGHSEGITREYDMKYIRKRNGLYYIQKHINGELKCFKSSKSLKEAVEIRDKLIENNWRDNGQLRIEELNKIREFHLPVWKIHVALRKHAVLVDRNSNEFKLIKCIANELGVDDYMLIAKDDI